MTLAQSQRLGGALAGLALFCSAAVTADDSLREQVRREYGHRNYILIEDAAGARLYLFPDASNPAALELLQAPATQPEFRSALARTHSADAAERVRGLVELAGVASAEALDVALALLNDPSPAVRDEAASLILDHPDGASIARSLGLDDEDE